MLTSVESPSAATSCRTCATTRGDRRRRRLHAASTKNRGSSKGRWSDRRHAAAQQAIAIDAALVVALLPAARRGEHPLRSDAHVARRLGRQGHALEGRPASGGRSSRCRRFRPASRRTTSASCSARTSSRRTRSCSTSIRIRRSTSARRTSGSARGRTATSTATRSSAASSPIRSARSRITGTARANLFLTPGAFSDRLTRGGPLVARRRASWSSDQSLGSDDRKTFSFSVDTHADETDDGRTAARAGDR